MPIDSIQSTLVTRLLKSVDARQNGVSNKDLSRLAKSDSNQDQHISATEAERAVLKDTGVSAISKLDQLVEQSKLTAEEVQKLQAPAPDSKEGKLERQGIMRKVIASKLLNPKELAFVSNKLPALADTADAVRISKRLEQAQKSGQLSGQELAILNHDASASPEVRQGLIARMQDQGVLTPAQATSLTQELRDLDRLNSQYALCSTPGATFDPNQIVFDARLVQASRQKAGGKGFAVEGYDIGRTPEETAAMFSNALQGVGGAAYTPAGEGCEEFANLLQTALTHHETSVRYPKAQLTKTADGRDVHGMSLDKLQELADSGDLKPGMTVLVNSNPGQTLKNLKESDRHWFTYVGKKDGKAMFIDNWNKDKLWSADEMKRTYSQVRTSKADEWLRTHGNYTGATANDAKEAEAVAAVAAAGGSRIEQVVHDNPGAARSINAIVDPYGDNRAEFEKFAAVLLATTN